MTKRAESPSTIQKNPFEKTVRSIVPRDWKREKELLEKEGEKRAHETALNSLFDGLTAGPLGEFLAGEGLSFSRDENGECVIHATSPLTPKDERAMLIEEPHADTQRHHLKRNL